MVHIQELLPEVRAKTNSDEQNLEQSEEDDELKSMDTTE